MGAPGDTALQRRVLLAALQLLDAPEGPILLDFSEETDESGKSTGEEPAVWACPVSFTPPPKEETDLEKLISTFRREVAQLRVWYDLGVESKGRTAVVNFEPDSALQLLSAYALNAEKKSSGTDLSFAVALRLAAQDLKACYFEAAIARPGAALPESKAFSRWFWTETAAGLVLKAIKGRCVNEADKSLRMTGTLLLVPLEQG